MSAWRFWVLNRQQLLRVKLLISHQIKEVLWFLVELLLCAIRVHVTCLTDGDDMTVLREGLICDWAVILTSVILEETQLDQICLLHWLTCHGIFSILSQIWHYV